MLLWTFGYKVLCGHYVFTFLGSTWGVELLDYMVSLFNLLRSCQTVFQSTILRPPQQCLRVPVFLHPCQHLSSSVFYFSHPYWVWREFSLWFWFFISLITNYVKHLFMCLLAICTSLEQWLFKSFVQFLIRLFILLLSYKNSLYILVINPLSDLQIFASVLCIAFLPCW